LAGGIVREGIISKGFKLVSKRRVLQVFNRYLEYGGEQRVVECVPEWLRGVCEVETCLFESTEWKGADAPPLWKQPVLMGNNRAALARLRAMHERFWPDVWLVSNVFPVASAGVYRLALELRVPIVHFAHNFRPFSVGGMLWANGRIVPDGLQQKFLPEVLAGAWQGSVLKSACMALALKTLHRQRWLRSVKAWVAISDFMRARLLEARVPASDVFSLRHPWTGESAPPETLRDAGYYLFLARLHETKGVKVALDAWRKIHAARGERGPRLWMAGTGPMEETVRAAARENPLIKACGMLSGEAKADALRNCRAMLAPSVWWEPLGIVTYEAYAHGKPMLAARSGGLTETVVEGVTGFLHEPGNADELAAQVLRIEETPAQALEMGLAGQRWLSENARLADWTQRMEAVFEHAIAEGAK